MSQGFLRLLIPSAEIGIVDTLATQAINNSLSELTTQIGSFDVRTCGLYRNSTHYRFDVVISNELIHETMSIDVEKASFETQSLAILEAMPYLKL